jgi:hypothetical protein
LWNKQKNDGGVKGVVNFSERAESSNASALPPSSVGCGLDAVGFSEAGLDLLDLPFIHALRWSLS